jgi:hypothetical protein
MRRLYEPESYFGRLFAGYRESPDFRRRRAARPAAAAAPRKISTRLGVAMAGVVQASKLGRAMQQAGMLKRLGGAYLQVWWRLNRPLGRDAIPFQVFVGMCVIHWHFFNMAQRPRDVTFGNVAANLDSVAA